MFVRAAAAEDTKAIGGIRVAAWRTAYREFMPAEYLDSPDPRQGLEGLVVALQSPEPPFRVKVVESVGMVRGFVMVGPPGALVSCRQWATALYESTGFVLTGESRTTSALTGHSLRELAYENVP